MTHIKGDDRIKNIVKSSVFDRGTAGNEKGRPLNIEEPEAGARESGRRRPVESFRLRRQEEG